ncbi:hypothetical protein vseg_014013 [Gypsophila vaccaria]
MNQTSTETATCDEQLRDHIAQRDAALRNGGTKRAITSYCLFQTVERENIGRENPGVSLTELARIIGQRWRNMTVEEKEPYERLTYEFNAPSLGRATFILSQMYR